MEEQILKILKAGSYELRNTRTGNWLAESYAKEITSMVMDFIEWFTGETSPVSILYGKQKERFATTKTDYTIEELFDYWFNNIRNK